LILSPAEGLEMTSNGRLNGAQDPENLLSGSILGHASVRFQRLERFERQR
jgi:hypothetical protein